MSFFKKNYVKLLKSTEKKTCSFMSEKLSTNLKLSVKYSLLKIASKPLKSLTSSKLLDIK